MLRRGLLGFLLFVASLGSAWAQCAPGIPCAGNPAGIPPDQPNSPYYQGNPYGNPGQYPQQQSQQAPALWGSLAISDQGVVAWTYNQPNAGAAERAAMKSCKSGGGQNCRVLDNWSEACAALGRDAQGKLYMGYGASVPDTEEYAIAQCRRENPTAGCQLYSLAICSGSNFSEKYEGDASNRAASMDAQGFEAANKAARRKSGRYYWGAFAVGPHDNAVRITVDELEQKEAESHALARCKGDGCRVLASFHDTCMGTGYATDPAKNDEYLKVESNNDAQALGKSLSQKCDAKYGPKQCVVLVRCTGPDYLDNSPLAKKEAPVGRAHQ
jgi:hypothetical protein